MLEHPKTSLCTSEGACPCKTTPIRLDNAAQDGVVGTKGGVVLALTSARNAAVGRLVESAIHLVGKTSTSIPNQVAHAVHAVVGERQGHGSLQGNLGDNRESGESGGDVVGLSR